MAHTFTHLLTHIIFSTKDRAPLLDAELKSRLFPYMGGIIRELDGKALIINGPADHVHILAVISQRIALADFMRILKTNSSRWVHDQSPQRKSFAWQTGYGAFSVSHSNLAAVVHRRAGRSSSANDVQRGVRHIPKEARRGL